MAIEYPLVNGHRYSFSSIELKINGTKYIGVKSINYDDGLKPAQLGGTTPVMIGRTRGKYEAKGDVEFYRLEAQAVIDALGDGFYEVPFDIVVQYSENDDTTVTTDNLIGVRLESTASSNTDGPEAATLKFGLNIIVPVKWGGKNGVTPIDTFGTTSI